MTTAFQSNAFQNNAFQIDAVSTTETIDGRSGGKRRRQRSADDELSELEVQFMRRKLRELKRAKTEREKERAAKELEVALAQAAQDEEAAEVITEAITESKLAPTPDYRAVLGDISLLTKIIEQLSVLAKEIAKERMRLADEDDIEILLLMT